MRRRRLSSSKELAKVRRYLAIRRIRQMTCLLLRLSRPTELYDAIPVITAYSTRNTYTSRIRGTSVVHRFRETSFADDKSQSDDNRDIVRAGRAGESFSGTFLSRGATSLSSRRAAATPMTRSHREADRDFSSINAENITLAMLPPRRDDVARTCTRCRRKNKTYPARGFDCGLRRCRDVLNRGFVNLRASPRFP